MPRLFPLLFVVLLTSACGQSGDLYLPGNAPESSDPLEAADDAVDEDADGDADEDDGQAAEKRDAEADESEDGATNG